MKRPPFEANMKRTSIDAFMDGKTDNYANKLKSYWRQMSSVGFGYEFVLDIVKVELKINCTNKNIIIICYGCDNDFLLFWLSIGNNKYILLFLNNQLKSYMVIYFHKNLQPERKEWETDALSKVQKPRSD